MIVLYKLLYLLAYFIVPPVLFLTNIKFLYASLICSLSLGMAYIIGEMISCTFGLERCSSESHEVAIYLWAFVFGLIYSSIIGLLVRGLRALIRYCMKS